MAPASSSHACASAIGSRTSGTARWPDCMAALFAMARQRSAFAAALRASSRTTDRSHENGRNAATPNSVAWRMTVSTLSPFARPCMRTTCGVASGSSRCRAMRTCGSASSNAAISHSK